ncbi:hypothetical protein C7M84_011341 [Penaeus vannamei]|uniref:Uncharacterized protein n=1 Tax=Penaeus vannamei TaxID=6689 RepID=A0A423T1F8_PENVA|nr:hypothetical protein C7M84_011341 [Penaeus vannamei]
MRWRRSRARAAPGHRRRPRRSPGRSERRGSPSRYPQTRPQPYPPGDPRIYQRPTCPMPRPVSNENRWEYLKRVVSVQNQCRIRNPCTRCPLRKSHERCVFDFDTLMTRLALLEGKLKDMAKLEARLKIHVSLLMSIQSNANCE